MIIPFTKMHGLSNDLVVLDVRTSNLLLDPAEARLMADRRLGVGCDQIILIEPSKTEGALAYLRILNADGSASEACGNGTRCVAAMLMEETGKSEVVVETTAGLLRVSETDDGQFTVNMGEVRYDWKAIPLAKECDTLHLSIEAGSLIDPVAVNVGNPHCVFFVEDVHAVDLAKLGPKIEHATLFPERTNVEVASVLDERNIRMRVWERGVGITPACGSGACATLVAAHRRNLVNRKVTVILDGGDLTIEWLESGDILMTGPVSVSFSGTWNGMVID